MSKMPFLLTNRYNNKIYFVERSFREFINLHNDLKQTEMDDKIPKHIFDYAKKKAYLSTKVYKYVYSRIF